MPGGGAEKHKWWKEASIYQIYPASFKDGNNDGWGDLKGIQSKLDHIRDLGVDVIWISPIYPSPQVDMGYDISDYKDIDPRYGSLADMDELIAAMKARGLRLMMDLVVNHTSDQHAWFKASRASRDNNPMRDWYIWKPARGFEDGGKTPIPPNNWEMLLKEGQSAWTWDEGSREFYLSLFTPEQPDLNWELPEVRAAVHDVMTFWLERGASGFRMDVINHISKVQTFPDAPVVYPDPNKRFQPGNRYYANGPRMHEFLREIYDKVLAKYDAITVGEMPFVEDADEVLRVVGDGTRELQMIFIFDIVEIDGPRDRWIDWKPRDLAAIVARWQRIMLDRGGWNSVFAENHDQPRSVTRYTDDGDEWRVKGSKLMCLMLSTLSGTLYIYQGQELGMRNLPPDTPLAEYRDVLTQAFWKDQMRLHPGDPAAEAAARKSVARKARDHARTPVQWRGDRADAGFSDGGGGGDGGGDGAAATEPWMCVNPDYRHVNAQAQADPAADAGADGGITTYHFWKRAVENRRRHKDVFVYGDFALLADGSEAAGEVFAYLRTSPATKEKFLTALNFTPRTTSFRLPDGIHVDTWVAGNYAPGQVEGKARSGAVELRPWEGLLGQCA